MFDFKETKTQYNTNIPSSIHVRRTPNSLQIGNKRCALWARHGSFPYLLNIDYLLYCMYTYVCMYTCVCVQYDINASILFGYWFPTGVVVYELVSRACLRAKVSHFEIDVKTTREAKTTQKKNKKKKDERNILTMPEESKSCRLYELLIQWIRQKSENACATDITKRLINLTGCGLKLNFL